MLSFELSLNLRAALVVLEFPLGHQPRRDLVDRLRLAVLVHPTFALRSPLAYSALAMTKPYTVKQGQYLAFIYYYSKIHGRPPAEAEMQQYFRVSPSSVHQMILTLETQASSSERPGRPGRSVC